MQVKQGTFCPLLKKDCVMHSCAWFTQLRGTNPNTGKEVDEWNCSMAVLPLLLVQTANETRQGAAATESFRNEFVRGQAQSTAFLAEALSGPRDVKLIG